MRVAVLTWYSPAAPDSGERVRLANICEQLAAEFEVEVVSLEKGTRPGGTVVERRLPGGQGVPYRWGLGAKLLAVAQRRALHEVLLGDQPKLRHFVEGQLTDISPHAVLVSQLPPWPLLPPLLASRAIVDTQNAEGLRLARLAEHASPRGPLKLLTRQQAKAATRLESSVAQRAAMMWAVSPEDVEYFDGLGGNSVLIPNGVSIPPVGWRPRSVAVERDRPLRLLYVGSFSYGANVDAIRWFVREWAPQCGAGSPWVLDVVGSGPTATVARIIAGDSRLRLVGRVPDISAEYLNHDALIVPMRLGGGSRLKVIEAAAHGLPIVCTAMGAEGSGLQAGAHFLQVNSPSDWPGVLATLTTRPDVAAAVAARAVDVAMGLTWNRIGLDMRSSVLSVAARASNTGAI